MPWQLAGQLTVEAGSCRENDLPYFAFWFTDEELERAIRNSMLDARSSFEGHTLLLQKLIAIAAELPLPK